MQVGVNADFGLILNAAVRYSLGRETYMPMSVCTYIMPLVGALDDATVWCMAQDIRRARDDDSLGDDDIDAPHWLDLLAALNDEIALRGLGRGR